VDNVVPSRLGMIVTSWVITTTEIMKM